MYFYVYVPNTRGHGTTRIEAIVDEYTPEARALNSEIIDIIDDPADKNVDEVMLLADSSVALFRQLFQPASG